MIKGFWNGEPADIIGVTYTVSKIKETPLHWQNNIAGTKRQGLKVRQKAAEFIIDNEHGDGYYKVTEGRGMWTAGHKTVVEPTSVIEIPDAEIKTVFDKEANAVQSKEFDKWAAKNHPKEFMRLQQLRAQIKNK